MRACGDFIFRSSKHRYIPNHLTKFYLKTRKNNGKKTETITATEDKSQCKHRKIIPQGSLSIARMSTILVYKFTAAGCHGPDEFPHVLGSQCRPFSS